MTPLAVAIARTPAAALGGAQPKLLALTLAMGHVDERGRLRAPQRLLVASTGMSRSSVQRAWAALRRCGILMTMDGATYLVPPARPVSPGDAAAIGPPPGAWEWLVAMIP